MLDWLRYFPLVLGFRHTNEYVTPKGPYFPKLRSHQWLLGDNVFHLAYPKSNPVFGTKQYRETPKQLVPGKLDILTQERYIGGGSSNETLGRWDRKHFFFHEWFFIRPWFAGVASELRLFADVVTADKCESFNGSSFFHPRVFENVIGDFLDSYFGHETSGGGPLYQGPHNWQVLEVSNLIQAVRCDVHEINGVSDNDDPVVIPLVFFPVSDDHFISLKFDFFGTSLKSTHANPAPMFELTNAIIDSFRLEVGKKTAVRWDEIKQGCPDMSLTKSFGQLQWPIEPDQIGKPRPATAQIEQASR